MMQTTLVLIHGALLLLFGIFSSLTFSGIRLTKQNILRGLSLFALCGALQILLLALFSEDLVWKLYPVITHLPLVLFLCVFYHKRIVTALSSVFTAYLCCQPAKWFSMLIASFTNSIIITYLTRICILFFTFVVIFRKLAPYLSKLFGKDLRSVCIFGAMPMIYYFFDYATGIYTDLWIVNSKLVSEFFPCFFCFTFMTLCVMYYQEQEQKEDALRKEQYIGIAVEQQAKELESIKRREFATHLLRHDMRLFLNNLAISIEQEDKETSIQMISGFVSQIDTSHVHRYCSNDTVNYTLANFESKCHELEIPFQATLELGELTVDETMLASILSNALDNAINAQKELPVENRQIQLMLKSSDHKLLLSVKNPFKTRPVFSDGLPISRRTGHGYGTQSIRYLTERLGGKCQFLLQDNLFVLRVIL